MNKSLVMKCFLNLSAHTCNAYANCIGYIKIFLDLQDPKQKALFEATEIAVLNLKKDWNLINEAGMSLLKDLDEKRE